MNVNTLGKEENFYKINYKGKIGFISSAYVKIIDGKSNISKNSTSSVIDPAVKVSGVAQHQQSLALLRNT